uniref:ATP-dependent transporter ycf16 n=1 Tax=Entomoneis paludosa TaxID=265537 RepID=A0A7S2V8Y6_9STRA
MIQQAVTTQSVSVLRAIAMSTGSAVMLFNTSATLAALSLATLPPLFLGARVVGQQLREQQKTVQSLHGKSTTAAEETMSGMTTVVQFGAEKQELARYSDLVQKAHQAAIETGRTQALFDGSVHVAANGAILCVLGYGGSLVMQGSITAGDLTGFLMYSLLLAGNVSSLSSSFTEFSKAVAGFDRIMDIMDRQPAIPSGFNEEKTTTVQHDTPLPVEYRNVDFSYPTRPDEKILDRFTLRVEPGEVLAIVGGSGSGKSTLARLLTRLYDVNGADGEIEDDSSTGIFINNKDIRDWDPVELRQEAIGIVSQEPWLIDASIEENIRYGRPSATDEQVLEAAQLANVVSFTDSFPEGLKTPVGPRGTQLSGGQKQRVAIARLILKDPPIVILDEATSALDAQSEHLVQKAIDSVMKGRTVISIAHRLSTIKGADRIAVLGDGQVLEVGTFEELSRKEDGAFKSLMGRQILTQ